MLFPAPLKAGPSQEVKGRGEWERIMLPQNLKAPQGLAGSQLHPTESLKEKTGCLTGVSSM